jgi:hypothetical protein
VGSGRGALLAALALFGVGVAACGGDDSTSGAPATTSAPATTAATTTTVVVTTTTMPDVTTTSSVDDDQDGDDSPLASITGPCVFTVEEVKATLGEPAADLAEPELLGTTCRYSFVPGVDWAHIGPRLEVYLQSLQAGETDIAEQLFLADIEGLDSPSPQPPPVLLEALDVGDKSWHFVRAVDVGSAVDRDFSHNTLHGIWVLDGSKELRIAIADTTDPDQAGIAERFAQLLELLGTVGFDISPLP